MAKEADLTAAEEGREQTAVDIYRCRCWEERITRRSGGGGKAAVGSSGSVFPPLG
jgi:hypothetical protein